MAARQFEPFFTTKPETLTAAGCSIVLAADGAEALRAWPEAGPAPQVLVSDYRLSDTDGVDLLCRLGERWPEAIRILTTSHRSDDMPPLEERGIRLLSKPFVPEQLLEAIGQGIAAGQTSDVSAEV